MKKTLSIIALILSLFGLIGMLAGCKQLQPVQHTFYKKDSVIYHEKLVPIDIKGSDVKTSLSRGQYDSLVLALKSMPAGHKTIYMTDPKMQTRMEFFLDSLGHLSIKCETLEKEYQAKLTEKDHVINSYEKIIETHKKTFGEQLKQILFVALGIVGLIVTLAIILFVKKFV